MQRSHRADRERQRPRPGKTAARPPSGAAPVRALQPQLVQSGASPQQGRKTRAWQQCNLGRRAALLTAYTCCGPLIALITTPHCGQGWGGCLVNAESGGTGGNKARRPSAESSERRGQNEKERECEESNRLRKRGETLDAAGPPRQALPRAVHLLCLALIHHWHQFGAPSSVHLWQSAASADLSHCARHARPPARPPAARPPARPPPAQQIPRCACAGRMCPVASLVYSRPKVQLAALLPETAADTPATP